MAITSYGALLMHKESTGGEYKKFLDIKSFPNIGGKPEKLECTTTSDKQKRYKQGLLDSEDLDFNCNYTLEDYKKVKVLEGKTEEFAVWFGCTEAEGGTITATEGKYAFSGEISATIQGAETNSIVDMTVSIVPNSEIKLVE